MHEEYLNKEKKIMEIQCEILNLNEGNGKIKNTNEIQQKNLEIQKLKEEQERILKKKGKI